MSKNYNPTYIADFICTYKMFDEYEDSLILYQLQLLQAFNLVSYDITSINKAIEDLYEKYKENSYISKLIDNIKLSNADIFTNVEKDLMAFTLCFQYETLYLFHYLLCSLINEKPINEGKYNKLIQIISKENCE